MATISTPCAEEITADGNARAGLAYTAPRVKAMPHAAAARELDERAMNER